MSILNSYSAIGVGDDAPPLPAALEAGVLDRERDEVYTENGGREMTYDELHEILAWMPAKAAIRFSSSLCTWSRSIHSDLRFIENQCTRSRGHDNGFFLQQKLRKRDLGRVDDNYRAIEFNVLPCEMGSAFGVPSASLVYLSKCRLFYSSNGLLLLGKGPKETLELIVCNPATREWATLPTPKGFEIEDSEPIGFSQWGHDLPDDVMYPLIECYPWGHDLLEDVKFPYDYTIALPVQARTKNPPTTLSQYGGITTNYYPDTIRHGLLIYSNGIWDDELWDVSIEGRSLRLNSPVAFFSDATKGLVVHYMCDSKESWDPEYGSGEHTYMDPFIAAFDIREKKLMRQIELPDEAWISDEIVMHEGTRRNMWIEKWNENSIILVRWARYGGHCGSIAAWVLDDYGCKGESWRLVMWKSQMEMWNDYNWDWTMGVGVASGRGLLIATTPRSVLANDEDVSFDELKSRVFLYVVEGENQGKMELVGDHHFEHLAPVRFVPYSNTLRPVSVKNAQTSTQGWIQVGPRVGRVPQQRKKNK